MNIDLAPHEPTPQRVVYDLRAENRQLKTENARLRDIVDRTQQSNNALNAAIKTVAIDAKAALSMIDGYQITLGELMQKIDAMNEQYEKSRNPDEDSKVNVNRKKVHEARRRHRAKLKELIDECEDHAQTVTMSLDRNKSIQ